LAPEESIAPPPSVTAPAGEGKAQTGTEPRQYEGWIEACGNRYAIEVVQI